MDLSLHAGDAAGTAVHAPAPAAQALLVFAEPSLLRTRLSRRIGELAGLLDGVRVQDLYERYPDCFIDARAERALVRAAQLLLFVFPLRSYHPPSLLVEWVDTVLREDRAAWRGKACWAIVSCDGAREDYRPGGPHGHAVATYLRGLEQGAASCGMDWIEPHVHYDAASAGATAIDAHASKLRDMIARRLERLRVDGGGDAR